MKGEEYSHALYLGSVSREFGVVPSEAHQEWLDHGDELDAVMEALAFAQVAQMVIDGADLKVIPDGRMKTLALVIRRDLDEQEVREVQAQRHG